MPRRRLGVALLLPAPVAQEVDGLRKAVGDPSLGRIPPHLTLVPPVNVREEHLAEALEVLRDGAGAARPFTLGLGPPATFQPQSPVLYLAVGAGGPQVHALREAVFRRPLARDLTWPYVPHVTLADGLGPARLDAALAALGDYRAEARVDVVHLLEEGPGRIWAPIARAPVGGPAVVGRGGLPLELSVTPGPDPPDPESAAFAAREWARYDEAELGPRAGAEGREQVEQAEQAQQAEQVDDETVRITARRQGEVVGVARGEMRAGRGHLSDLLVGEAVRGQGIGSHLLAAFESWAAAKGAGRLSVRTRAGGGAEGFYLERGWVEEARLPRWRDGLEFVQLRRDLS